MGRARSGRRYCSINWSWNLRSSRRPQLKMNFAGSDRGAEPAAVMATLIMTARLNDIDPKAWLADVLACIANIPQSRLCELWPWNWTPPASTLFTQARSYARP
ncbi:transposase domain-containing protein [Bradyrhizobium zhanjiangense]|uniref:Transposase domain-containing protein n=1 Tax=Bradyrhizobium zhanjiangense TaxID=1325107 RepID=A0A4Q0QMR5_9BRAD|nr:transposase domain-containing protein [Bradyrhizobium zhanjiangense]RXG95763.1 transposase domain-containing protein [Bradyrhizobium zhanjiangense]